jgi:hypothetical protein
MLGWWGYRGTPVENGSDAIKFRVMPEVIPATNRGLLGN